MKKKLEKINLNRKKIIILSIITISIVTYIIIKEEILNSKYETYKTLDNYEIEFEGEIKITNFTGTEQGNAELITSTDKTYSVKLSGRKKGKYAFTVTDEKEKEYLFKYYYEKSTKSIVLTVNRQYNR